MKAKIKNSILIFTRGLGIAFRVRMAYRFDFIACLFLMLVSDVAVTIATFIIYQNGVSFPGWTFNDVLLMQSIFLLAKGIAFPLYFGMSLNTLFRVADGIYDLLLIKPHSTLFMSIVTGFEVEDFGKTIGGIILFTYAVLHMQIPSVLVWISFAAVFICSLLVLFSFALLIAATSFVWVQNYRLFEVFDTIALFGQYPGSIYPSVLKNVISYAVPVLMIGFFPASVLLSRPGSGLLFACGASVIMYAVSFMVYKIMSTRHVSAGG